MMDNTMASDSEAASTDQDQDDSLDMCSTSSTDDLNMNDEEMRLFDTHQHALRQPKKNLLFQEPTDENFKFLTKEQNKKSNHMTSSLQNPGSMISDFYISNMNYAMRYSVEYVQQVAKDIRSRRERQDSMACANERTRRNIIRASDEKNETFISRSKLNRSSSVDRLYAVRREHIKYANGADEYYGAKNISFTTDDIQDIYMPSAIDNYKRKIAVELERRRRTVENNLNEHQRLFSPEHFEDSISHTPQIDFSIEIHQKVSVVLDDLDIFIIKKAKSSIESERILAEDKKLKIFQPDIYRNVDHLNSKIYEGIPLINKPHVSFPITHNDHKQKTISYIQTKPICENPILLDQADVRVQTSFSQYAVVTDKISPCVMENEVIPSSSSDSESMSLSPVDSLINLSVEHLNETIVHSDKLAKARSNKISFKQDVRVLKAKDSISMTDHLNYVNVNQVPTNIDATQHVSVQTAEWNIEREAGNFTSNVNISYPPETRHHSDRAKMNYEHGALDLANVNVSYPPVIKSNQRANERHHIETNSYEASRSKTSNKQVVDKEIKLEHLREQIIQSSGVLNKVDVNYITPLNLAHQRSSLQPVQYSRFLPPDQTKAEEPSYRISSDELQIKEHSVAEKLDVLNAPTANVDKIHFVKAEQMIPSKVPLEAPEYIIEEFAHKPIDSQITYSYEQIDTLKHKDTVVNKCHQSVVPHQTSLKRPKTRTVETLVNARINQFEHVNDDSSQIVHENVVNTDSLQFSIESDTLKTRQHIAKPFSAVSMSQDHILEDIKPLDNTTSLSTLETRITEDNDSLHKLSHVLVPLNIYEANQSEFRAQIDELLLEFHPKLSNIEQPLQVQTEIECNEQLNSKTKIKSLSLARIDDLSSCSDVESINTNDEEKEEHLQELNHLVVLETGVQQTRANVLSLACHDYCDENVQNQMAKSLDADRIEELTVNQNTQGFFVSLKATVSEMVHLNAPAAFCTDIELHQAEELYQKDSEAQQIASLKLNSTNKMIKPVIAKKPKVIGNAAQYKSQISIDEVNEFSQESRDLANTTITKEVSLQKSFATTVKNMAMGVYSTVEMLNEDLVEIKTEAVEENAQVTEEDTIEEKATTSEQPEQICKARHAIDSDGETVKPMDTIDINFQENVNIEQTYEDETRSSLNVKLVQSFNRPLENNVLDGQEDCKEFFSYESSEETKHSFQDEFEESSVVKFNPVNEMAQGKTFKFFQLVKSLR